MSWSGTIDPKKPTGYEFAISRVLGVGGQKFKPSLSTEQVERVVKSSFFWTPSGVNAGILHFPSNEEKCVIIAQAFRSIPKLVEWAWFDRSEYMTADVRKILGNAKSSVPAAEEAPRPKKAAMVEVEDDDDFSPPVSKKPAAPARPANNQTFTDDDDDLDLPVLKKIPVPAMDDDEDEAVVATPVRPAVQDDDEDDAELSAPVRKQLPVDEDDLEEGEATEDDDFEEDGEDDDDMPPPPKSARNAPPKSPAPRPPRKK
jgi:hypothetical protein